MTTASSSANATLESPLLLLQAHGQSPWLDFVRRSLLESGALARLVELGDVTGVTTNPAIFERAIAGSREYDADLDAGDEDDPEALYERVAVADVRAAADVLRAVHERAAGHDGHVSLEVSPRLARDTEGTVAAARRLWAAVDRPNVMIKVPGTPEGLRAVRRLIADGLNVNVTLLFSLGQYRATVAAFRDGIADRVAAGGDVRRVASVASFFVSRIDAAVDAKLTGLAEDPDPARREAAEALRSRVAIANARLAYGLFRDEFARPDWLALAEAGARPQRLLWASTGTKDARLSDVLYVEELVGPGTVNTMPPATLDAFRDHGRVRPSIEEDAEGASRTLARLADLGISLDAVTQRLLEDGLAAFDRAYDLLLAAVAAHRAASAARREVPELEVALPQDLTARVAEERARWRTEDLVRRVWAADATVWTGRDEDRWLGWLGLPEAQRARIDEFRRLAAGAREEGVSDVLVLGMGGSSLCAEVLARAFPQGEGAAARLLVCDSTDPAQVAALRTRANPARTLYVVASKSGSTLEPNLFLAYFLDQAARVIGPAAAKRFLAVTDPGSSLERSAVEHGFRAVLHGVPSVGGRFSALSDFGLVPAALAGLDVALLLDRACAMAARCRADADENPGVELGLLLGAAAQAGRDKVTLSVAGGVDGLGAWLEQLLAESTGKDGRGLIPVDGEPLAGPEAYGNDRLFVRVALAGEPDAAVDARLAALAAAGHPVVTIVLRDRHDLAGEFFRWEFATAVAGAVLRVNPFDQPDVEASKLATRALMAAFEREGALPMERPFLAEDGLRLHADAHNADVVHGRALPGASLSACLAAHLDRLRPGFYVALQAFLPMTPAIQAALAALQARLRDTRRAAVCVGFGPRFLHSTGQAMKGGPNTGVFLQLTCDDTADLPVPGTGYTFGVVKAAQARGDLEAMAERGRRLLRVHLGPDPERGLVRLAAAFESRVG